MKIVGAMAQNNELGLGRPRILVNPRSQRDLDDLRYKPYHRRQRKRVRGETPPQTLKIWSRGMFKPLKRIL